jgi:hypothetical protein
MKTEPANKKRAILFRAGTICALLIIGAVMMVIGRGHTIYLDNRTLEYEGAAYEAPFRVEALVGGERVASLAARERGVAECIGQTFNVTLNVTQERDGTEETYDIKLPVPYGIDGVIINLPAYLAGLPEEAYLTEFVPIPDTTEEEEELLPSEEEFIGDI